MGTAVYDASKHAVLSLSESLYKDLVNPADQSQRLCALPRGRDDADLRRRTESAAEAAATSVTNSRQGSGPPFPGLVPHPLRFVDRVFAAVREKPLLRAAAQDVMYE